MQVSITAWDERAESARRRGPRRGGQVLLIVLLAMTALVGLAFYAYNAGGQINRRVELQNEADAVAVSGAAWMARSMNSVAMNNVSQSRMLALVPTFDAMPLSAEISVDELNDFIGDRTEPPAGLTAVSQGLAGPIAGLDADRGEKILKGIDAILHRLKRQRAILEPFAGDDFKEVAQRATYWSKAGVGGAPPHGRFWRAAGTLDDYSRSIVGSAGRLAQANAVRFGRRNGVEGAFVVPVAPKLPAERGTFGDFAYVLRKRLRVSLKDGYARVEGASNVGGAIPNAEWPHRLGPWARLFDRPRWYPYTGYQGDGRGWRQEWGDRRWVDLGTKTTVKVRPREGRQIVGPSAGGGLAGGGAYRGHGAQKGGTYTRPNGYHRLDVKGYTTFGPYHWAKRWVLDYASRSIQARRRANLGDTKFTSYYSKIADTKLKYMFGGVNPPLEKIHAPRWYTDLAEARKIAEDDVNRILTTRYYYIEVIYKRRRGVRAVTSHNLSNPVTKEFRGWLAPERLHEVVFGGNSEVTKAVQLGGLPMWKFTAEGVERRISPDGEVIEVWPVEFVWYFIFTGVDAGGERLIENPCNWDEYDELPAPWVLAAAAREAYTPDPDYDYKAADPDDRLSGRREDFAFLGVVRRRTRAGFWPAKFSSDNPLRSIVAVAQAKLINNTSWDLWTQDWQAQLTSVKEWDNWVDRLDEGVYAAQFTDGMVSADEVERIRDYMSGLGGYMAADYLTH